MMDKSEKIFVAGHRWLVGSALIRRLEAEGFANLSRRDRSQLNLADESAVQNFFAQETPAVVIFAAAKVGGIKANNDFPVEFLLDNLRIQNNIIRSAYDTGVRKLLFLGSSCRSEEHTSELQSRFDLVCRLLLEKKKKNKLNISA